MYVKTSKKDLNVRKWVRSRSHLILSNDKETRDLRDLGRSLRERRIGPNAFKINDL